MNFALLQCASKAPTRLTHGPKPVRSSNLLSWSFVCPSADLPDVQVSPTSSRRTTLRMPGTTRTSRSAFVVSLHHDGLLRTSAPGLLHPGTDPGVHCVSAFPEPESGTTAPRKRESSGPRPWLCQEASPQRGSYPSTNSPRQQPYRITAAVALLRLPLVPTRFPGAPRRAHLVRPTTLLDRDRDTLEAPAEASTTRCITAGGCPTIAEAMMGNHFVTRATRPKPSSQHH